MDVTLPGGVEVTLRPTLAPRYVDAINDEIGLMRSADPSAPAGLTLAILTEGYILYGVEAWNLTDDDGKPLPVNMANIRRHILEDYERRVILGDEANSLYAEAVMLPLLLMASRSSPDGPTESSTSAPTDSEDLPPTPSKRSSTSTTPTDATATTSASPAGVFKPSPRSKSAA